MRLSVSRDVWTNQSTSGHFVSLATGSVLEVAAAKLDYEMSAEDGAISIRPAVRYSSNGGDTWTAPVQFGNTVTAAGWSYNRPYALDARQGPLFEVGVHAANVSGSALALAHLKADITFQREARSAAIPFWRTGPSSDTNLTNSTSYAAVTWGADFGDDSYAAAQSSSDILIKVGGVYEIVLVLGWSTAATGTIFFKLQREPNAANPPDITSPNTFGLVSGEGSRSYRTVLHVPAIELNANDTIRAMAYYDSTTTSFLRANHCMISFRRLGGT